jgi:dolichol kinase
LAWAVFPAPFATAALLVLGLADPVASMVGRLAGGRRFGKGSVEGFSTFVTVAFLVLWPAVGAGPALVGAFVTAAAEVLPIPPDDNLVIPLVCGSVLWAMSVL